LPRPLVPEDLPKIEKIIRKLLKQDLSFKRFEIDLDEAIKLFANSGQPLKVELLENLRDKGTTSLSEEERTDLGDEKTKNAYLIFNLKRGNLKRALKLDFTDYFDMFKYASVKDFQIIEDYIIVKLAEIEIIDFLCAIKEFLDTLPMHYDDWMNIPEELQEELKTIDNLNNWLDSIIPHIKVIGKVNGMIKYYSADATVFGENPNHNFLDDVNEEDRNELKDIFWSQEEIEKGLSLIDTYKSKIDINIPKITIYRITDEKTGEILFEDLCKGPHIENIKKFNQNKIISLIPTRFLELSDLNIIKQYGEIKTVTLNNEMFYKIISNEIQQNILFDILKQGINSEYEKGKIKYAMIGYKMIIGNRQESLFEKSVLEIGKNFNVSEQDNKNLEYIFKQKIKDIETTQELGLSLDKFSASYWRGDQTRGINMQRLYALVFETKEELETFQTAREEAKKFDHRVLGQELDLFSFSDLVGSGLPLFSPKGTLLRNTLKAMLFQISKSYGCLEVTIPHMAKIDLYETSGHAKKFAGELFHVKSHYDIDFVLKPVNCPHHTQIFASKMRSYRDLPLRYIESTMQYRDEKPGAIGGLTRVRAITCDDGHTFCTPDQIKGEILSLCKTIEEFYTNLGMYGNHWVSISVRDYQNLDNYTGFPEDWDKAESMLKEINQELGLNGKVCEGEAAIYGPKLDFMYKDLQGNERQLSTVQLDFATPKRFGLTYKEADGTERPPVMIHRAILGSYERFLAILLESTKGRFPFWLAPVQIKILTINNQAETLEYVGKVKSILSEIVLMKPLKYNELRFEIDDRQESLGKKIREGEMAKIPVLLIIGPKDILENQVSVRTQGGEEKVKLEGLEEFLKNLK
jgi:threonyl-tRNA synthetase